MTTKRRLSPAEKQAKRIRILEKKARRAEEEGNFHEYAQIRLILNEMEDNPVSDDEDSD